MTDPKPPRANANAAADGTLRDARLTLALKHMPDAHLQPDPQARNAVLQAALQAVAPEPIAVPANWRTVWHWLRGEPGHRMPLTGAVASLLVASFITLMWHEQDVPDATPERSVAFSAPPAPLQERGEAPPTTATTTTTAATAPAAGEPTATATGTTRAKTKSVEVANSIAKEEVQQQAKAAPGGPRAVAPLATPLSPPPMAAPLATPAPPPVAASPALAVLAFATEAPPPPPPAPKALGAPKASVVLPAETRDGSPLRAESLARARQEFAPGDAVVVLLDGQQRTLTPVAGKALLAALRALPYQPHSLQQNRLGDGATGVVMGASSRREDAGGALAKSALESSAPGFTVQTNTGEVWRVSASGVYAFAPAGDSPAQNTGSGILSDAKKVTDKDAKPTARTSAITPAQWVQLQALAVATSP